MKFGLTLFLISILISIVILSPKVQTRMTKLFFKKERNILAQMTMELENHRYKVIKVFSPRGIFIEVYKQTNEGPFFLDSQILTDKRDGFYKFKDGKYNLFLKDIDGDGENEIVAPSVDKNMSGRLNVFSFDIRTEKLKKMSRH